MLHELKCDNATVKKVIRLGKRPESFRDQSARPREHRRKLVQELKDRKEKGETDLILVGDRIVKRTKREY